MMQMMNFDTAEWPIDLNHLVLKLYKARTNMCFCAMYNRLFLKFYIL